MNKVFLDSLIRINESKRLFLGSTVRISESKRLFLDSLIRNNFSNFESRFIFRNRNGETESLVSNELFLCQSLVQALSMSVKILPETSNCLSVPIENSDRPDLEKFTALIVSVCAFPDSFSSVFCSSDSLSKDQTLI